ncbi:MAG TPA: ABC transporter permease [Gemmatimonadaceae bacterium]|nr:ABC transporter permease [Gemmatimonadaceae bacterium]
MSLRSSFRHSWRSLRRAPAFSASVILTLAIGIGAATAIFAVVDAVLLRPLPYGDPGQLVGAWFHMPAVGLAQAQQTRGTYLTFARYAHTISGIAAFQGNSADLVDPDQRAEPAHLEDAQATANLSQVLEVPPKMGRWFTPEEDLPNGSQVVVLSDGLWKSHYGSDPHIIGKNVLIYGRSTEIIGVMPASFRFPDNNTQLWLPLRLDPNDPQSGGFNYNAVARLKPGVTLDQAEREFKHVLPRLVEVTPQMVQGVTTQMMLDQAKPVPYLSPLRQDVVGDVSGTLWMIAATALLVLLVTCTNVANLMLVRADARHREFAVRAALGAGRARVVGQFFGEAIVLASVAAALGLGGAWIGVRLLVANGPSQIPRLTEIHVGWQVILFTIVATLVAAFACSLVPAVRFLSGPVYSGLREGDRGGTTGRGRQRARSLLVGAQIAFALVVLATSGLLLRSFERLAGVRPGFDADGLATLWITTPHQRYPNDTAIVQFYAQLTQRTAEIPGVQSVGLTAHLPLDGNGMNWSPGYVDGNVADRTKIPPLAIFSMVDSGYFSTMRMPMVAGHGFDHILRQIPDEVVINRSAARVYFHDSTGANALGKTVRQLPTSVPLRVIGVVGDIRDTSLASPPVPEIYQAESVAGDTTFGGVIQTMALVVRTRDNVATTTKAMEAVVHEIDPTLPTFDVATMRDRMDLSMARLTFTMIILSVAAAVTLILGVIGLYGVIAYIVTLRRRELGVRIALGAQPASVAAMVTRQGLTLSVGGAAVGLALVAIVARFLRSFLFEVGPTDPVSLGGATALLVVLALAASWIPARRAARVNPIEAMRGD